MNEKPKIAARAKGRKLDPSFKRKWIRALRSGEYIQGCDVLCRVRERERDNGEIHNYEFCCLGVAAEICGLEWDKDENGRYVQGSPITSTMRTDESVFNIEDREDFLPEKYLSRRVQAELAALNDEGNSFKEIATWIKENL